MRITVVGGGYVGLVTGTCFAELGHTVDIVEIDAKKAAAINAGRAPIFEQGLDELLEKHAGERLGAGTDYALGAGGLAASVLSIPVHPGVTDEARACIADTINGVV